MSVTVKIPSPLRPLAGGLSEVSLEGATVGEVFRMLETQHKGFGERVLDGQSVRRFINVYVNEDNIRDGKELDTEVKSGDTISILPSIAGGLNETTVHAPGTFCWPELTTSDQAAAKTFYSTLFGWTFTDSQMGPDSVYTMFQIDGKPLGAATALDPQRKAQGVPPHWLSYVSIANADESAAIAKELGGTVIAGPFDVMDAGRMAMLLDPAGSAFALWQPGKHIGAQVIDQPGTLVWTELMTTNADVTREFYSKLFGWGVQLHPMGPMTYTVFKRGEAPAAGMMQMTPDMGNTPSHWLPYFGADDVNAIAAKAGTLGGRAIVPPADIPGIGRYSIIQDPQGATFGIIKFLPPAAK